MNTYVLSMKTPIQCFNSGNLISLDAFLHQKRILDCNVLIYVLEGELSITTDQKDYCVKSGQYVLLRQNIPHFGHKPSVGVLSYFWVHFRGEEPVLCDELPQNREDYYFLPEYGEASSMQKEKLIFLFRQLLGSAGRNYYTDCVMKQMLSLLLLEISQQYLDGTDQVKERTAFPVPQVMEWIRENCHRQITLQEIAEVFHYNPVYLSQLFRKETGTTMKDYLNQSRIEFAKRLLMDSRVSIKEAAFSSGFHDEKYFLKLFHRYTGSTPGQFRSALFS